MKLALPEVTLVCVDTRSPALAHLAIARCRAQVDFARCIFFTDPRKLSGLSIDDGVDVVDVRIDSIEAYSTFMIYGLTEHISTSHALVIQWDGFVADTSSWDPAFLAFDYIGAPWPDMPLDRAVGNGGFSLRSKRLLEALRHSDLAATHPEDVCICVDHRPRLEAEWGLRWPDAVTAARFSVESPDALGASFGFHGLWHLGDVLERHELYALLAELPDDVVSSDFAYRLYKRSVKRGDIEAAVLLLRARARLGIRDRRSLRTRLKIAIFRLRGRGPKPAPSRRRG